MFCSTTHNILNIEKKQEKTFSTIERWQLWVILNYEFIEGKTVKVQDILDHASSHKENVCTRADENSLTPCTLGKIMKKVWGDYVNLVKKGPRNSRYNAYKNIAIKNYTSPPASIDELDVSLSSLENLQLPSGWTRIKDCDNAVSFVTLTNIEFDGQRMHQEICFINQEIITIAIKNGPFRVNINEEFPIPINGSLIDKSQALMAFVEASEYCKGFPAGAQQTNTLIYVGTLNELDKNDHGGQERAFSKQCLIFSPTGGMCSHCYNLCRLQQIRMKRAAEAYENHPSKFCNNRYLDKDQIVAKHREEKRRRINAENREKSLREQFEDYLITMEEEDHQDVTSILENVDKKDIPQDMECLWEQQKKILQTSSGKAYRWHPKIIRLCLDLYCKNPHVLDSLREFIYLPSQRTIRMHKSKIEQKPGWNEKIINWCFQEANKQGLKEQDFYGGFIVDEMKIQENLEMSFSKGKHKLIGFVDLGETHNHMSNLSGNTDVSCQLAQHVLQFIFLSDSGFRFPIAQFPSAGCTPSSLYFVFWEGVNKMFDYNFFVYWCILDGAELNRQFIKLHFKDVSNPAEKHFVTHNTFTGNPMVFIVDCKHNFKKIRNNLEKSNLQSKPRCLILNGKKVMWSQLREAFEWDQASNSLPVHEKLTTQHFKLDPSTKMRNSLAEDALDSKMLFLIEAHQKALNLKGEDGSQLDSMIKLIKQTSAIISLFSDKLYITHELDPRMKQLMKFYDFLNDWKNEVKDSKNFISAKLWFDLQSMCLGFRSLVRIKLRKFPSSVIKPAIINQDCVENHFCQVRACNGQNNNPTYKLQQSCQNSIIYGQSTISRKSNAGKRINKISSSGASLPCS